MSKIPNGWTSSPLKLLVADDGLFTDGDWVESKDQDPNGSIRLLQLADIGDGRFIDKSSRFINEKKFTDLKCTELKQGDVLIARMPDPLGRACLMPELPQRCITVVDVAAFRPGTGSVLNKWLMYSINSPQVRTQIELNSSGTTRKRISRGNLGEISLPTPPLPEQKRIADKLDSVLARVDACRERLARAQPLLKRFRQSALAAATSGALTADWRAVRASAPHADARPSDYKSDALAMESPAPYEFVAQPQLVGGDLFAATEAPTRRYATPSAAGIEPASATSVGWADEGSPTWVGDDAPWAVQAQPNLCTVPLRDALLSIKTGPFGSSLHKSDYILGGTPIVNPMHLIRGKIAPTSEMSVDDATLARLSDFSLSNGDVVIGRRGEMGRCAVVTEKEQGWLCGTGSMILKPKPNLNSYYLQLFLSSPETVKALEGESVGSTMINLNQKILLSLNIYYPSIDEQHEIVRRVETLFAFADRLEARLIAAQTATERLTPALLAKAFRGELVPQDPNDEPASELLKRLAAARAAAPKPKRGRKTVPAAET